MIRRPVLLLVMSGNSWTDSYIADVGLEAVQIDEGVDSCLSEGIHATRMIAGFVDMVDTDCVCSKLFHESCVSLALFGIDKRIVFNKLIGNTCGRKLSVCCLG